MDRNSQAQDRRNLLGRQGLGSALLGQSMKLARVLRRVWRLPFGGAIYMLAGLAVFLIVAQVERVWGPMWEERKQKWEERQQVERLEQLLWRQAGAGQIASALEKLEIAETTGAIEPERAAEIRNRLERARTELRQRVRGMAQRLVRQKQERELKREQSGE